MKRHVSGRRSDHVALTRMGARDAVEALIKRVYTAKSGEDFEILSTDEFISDVSRAALEIDEFDTVS